MEVLKRNRHPHPLIYMRGTNSDDLVAMLDFLYYGEANVNQEHLDSFQALAEEMQLKGLTGSAENGVGTKSVSEKHPEKKTSVEKQHSEPIYNSPNFVDVYKTGPNTEREDSSKMPVALVIVEANNLDDQVKSMIGVSENMLTYGNETIRARICKVCGKEGHLTNIKTHIESNHIRSHVCLPLL